MPTIRPVSDLANYTELTSNYSAPVFLTEGGIGKYVLLDMETYDRMNARMELETYLDEGLASGGSHSVEDVFKELGEKYGIDVL